MPVSEEMRRTLMFDRALIFDLSLVSGILVSGPISIEQQPAAGNSFPYRFNFIYRTAQWVSLLTLFPPNCQTVVEIGRTVPPAN